MYYINQVQLQLKFLVGVIKGCCCSGIHLLARPGDEYHLLSGEQRWRSGESTRLPPMWPGFESRRQRHMWVEFVVGSLPFSERFFCGYSGFPLSSKTNISKFQFDQQSGRRSPNHYVDVLPANRYFFILFYLFYSVAFFPNRT